jgi:hypothetical protein
MLRAVEASLYALEAKAMHCCISLHVGGNYNLKSHKNIDQQWSSAHVVECMINIYCFSLDNVFILLSVLYFFGKTHIA